MIALCAATVGWAGSASAQYLPDFHTLVDPGVVNAPACGCIAAPFALPRHRPLPGYEGEAARLDVAAPPSSADRERYLAERRTLGRDVEDGLSGNPASSIGVAIHLSLQAAVLGADARTDTATMQWLHLAAEQGDSTAFIFLGYRYREGLGVEGNDEAAAYWFGRAAAEGSNVGMVALGLLYAAGRGVPQDWTAAVSWWRKAEARHPLAARFLGDAYICGVSAAADSARAVAAYRSAAERGEQTASVQLGHMIANGCADGDDEAAIAAFKRAAVGGLPEAQIALSEFLRSGRGGPSRHADAYYWARLAERRLPDGDLRMRAAAAVNGATRFLSVDEIAAMEHSVRMMLTEGAKPAR